ncbi:MAG: acetyl-CoA carboxylase biotin carboxyl carrier protein subunit [Ignavibacteria bacterium]|jgi:pyruvate carboxylase subunit B|nr:acetyl-CoA carboxylase biotin carboxyl carrier protein subunit [Ignavibacteria bacterium]MCU7499655.1 acetyl-CoA carboxylase biotin carboxyl carrier protein subunit [Ignavibacteria bacterium]MCU7512904.1 acetyl-CoA carboxylase biotin carboxyl carrier protein subunit [Ignavibacteria bacterium]MCU7521418.1 acetyl-CoA carboxylase biotin carboxyl carrier protein subunit [Ignavibacteria bacterium]MCU7524650.1 acetyl-CoA carboxylase biotin carboxyl carrier protein subunit [Ignavibacteria bacterium
MNEYVATVNGNKRVFKLLDSGKILFNEKEIEYSILKVSEYSYLLKLGNKVFDITTTALSREKFGFLVDGHYFETTIRTKLQEKAQELQNIKNKENHHDLIKSPMPGMILKIKKQVGDKIEMGESVVILEAMKMENDLHAPSSGIIKEIFVKEGSSVEKDTVLLTIS